MNRQQAVLEKIKQLLLALGFSEIIITNPYRSKLNYHREGLYCIPTYINSLGFLIEYAHSYEEAYKGGHEDGDAFPLWLGEDVILQGLENELRENMVGS